MEHYSYTHIYIFEGNRIVSRIKNEDVIVQELKLPSEYLKEIEEILVTIVTESRL